MEGKKMVDNKKCMTLFMSIAHLSLVSFHLMEKKKGQCSLLHTLHLAYFIGQFRSCTKKIKILKHSVSKKGKKLTSMKVV